MLPLADGNNQHSFEVKIGGVIGEERYSQRSFKANLFCRVVFPPLTDGEEVRNMLAQESPIMAKANATIEVMEMSPKEKWLYENRMKYEHDKASWKHVGYQEGIEQGSYQKAIETAKLMRMHNYPIAEICTMTGLTKEEVEAIN